jgi:hypothetical protein
MASEAETIAFDSTFVFREPEYRIHLDGRTGRSLLLSQLQTEAPIWDPPTVESEAFPGKNLRANYFDDVDGDGEEDEPIEVTGKRPRTWDDDKSAWLGFWGGGESLPTSPSGGGVGGELTDPNVFKDCEDTSTMSPEQKEDYEVAVAAAKIAREIQAMSDRDNREYGAIIYRDAMVILDILLSRLGQLQELFQIQLGCRDGVMLWGLYILIRQSCSIPIFRISDFTRPRMATGTPTMEFRI